MTEKDNKKDEKKKEVTKPVEDWGMGTCTHCGSKKLEVMTRVTGFFSKVNSWNKGKIGELKKRRDAINANVGALSGSSGAVTKKEKEN